MLFFLFNPWRLGVLAVRFSVETALRLGEWYDGRVYDAGAGTIGDLVGDLVAYRSLWPCDRRLDSFSAPAIAPRKIEVAYAALVGDLLRRARRLEAPDVSLERIVFVGDNVPSDGAAFANLCAVTGWEGLALIVDPQAAAAEPAAGKGARSEHEQFVLPDWAELEQWPEAGERVDQATAVVLDIDKTLLGARGRNDAIIDEARTTAMRLVCSELLGAAFDPAAFDYARQTFNRREFHPLTGDNQDYVAYICLLVAGNVIGVNTLETAVRSGEITSMAALVQAGEQEAKRCGQAVYVAHRVVAERIEAGDPTPFKAFRQREYLETVMRMAPAEDMPVAVRLRHQVTLTGEVFDLARRYQARGALLFALSDKPDEAALPTSAVAAQGYRALHWTPARIVSSQRIVHTESVASPRIQ